MEREGVTRCFLGGINFVGWVSLVYWMEFACCGLLGQVRWVGFAGSGFLVQVFWARFVGFSGLGLNWSGLQRKYI